MDHHKGHRSFLSGAEKRKKAHERNEELSKIVEKISDFITIFTSSQSSRSTHNDSPEPSDILTTGLLQEPLASDCDIVNNDEFDSLMMLLLPRGLR